MGYFWGRGRVQKLFSSLLELLFSIVPLILDFILGSFLNFWGPDGLFLGSG